jgi:hypothetical protein
LSGFDTLNERIREIEQALLDEPHARAQTPLSEGLLAFAKIDKEWRLLFITEKGDEIPLVNASIRVRIEAIRSLSKLEEAILMAHNQLVCAVDDAVIVADDWLKTRKNRR